MNHDAGASRRDDTGRDDASEEDPRQDGEGPAADGRRAAEGDHGDVMGARDAADVLADLEMTAAERSRVERGLLVVARELLAVTGAALLGHKGFSSVEELSTTERRRLNLWERTLRACRFNSPVTPPGAPNEDRAGMVGSDQPSP